MSNDDPLMSQQMLDLISVGEEIELKQAKEAGALGFMAQSMVLATLPHRDPGNVEIWSRENGNYALVVQSGVIKNNKGKLVKAGIPYGTKPRLIMAWITTEAVKTREKTLVLGDSMAQFMRAIGLDKGTGGKHGSITAVKDQLKRTLTANFSCLYSDENRDAGYNCKIAKRYDLWWQPQAPDQAALWESSITLNDDYHKEILANPVPIDIRALCALKNSALGLDIYLWLTYRVSYLTHTTKIPWISLMKQFGSNYKEARSFKFFFEGQLRKVQVVFPTLRIDSSTDHLILHPCAPSVAKVAVSQKLIKP